MVEPHHRVTNKMHRMSWKKKVVQKVLTKEKRHDKIYKLSPIIACDVQYKHDTGNSNPVETGTGH